MKYKCPTCGKTYSKNYCDECKKAIPVGKENNNPTETVGMIILIIGLLLVFLAIVRNTQDRVYIIAGGVSLALVAAVLLGISAVVGRLNIIIKMMQENNKDEDKTV